MYSVYEALLRRSSCSAPEQSISGDDVAGARHPCEALASITRGVMFVWPRCRMCPRGPTRPQRAPTTPDDGEQVGRRFQTNAAPDVCARVLAPNFAVKATSLRSSAAHNAFASRQI